MGYQTLCLTEEKCELHSVGSGEKTSDRYGQIVSKALKQRGDNSDPDFCCLLLQKLTNRL